LFSSKKSNCATGFVVKEDPLFLQTHQHKDTPYCPVEKRTGTIGDCLYALVKAFKGFGLEFVRPKLKF
jgi:hypothetical protein